MRSYWFNNFLDVRTYIFLRMVPALFLVASHACLSFMALPTLYSVLFHSCDVIRVHAIVGLGDNARCTPGCSRYDALMYDTHCTIIQIRMNPRQVCDLGLTS